MSVTYQNVPQEQAATLSPPPRPPRPLSPIGVKASTSVPPCLSLSVWMHLAVFGAVVLSQLLSVWTQLLCSCPDSLMHSISKQQCSHINQHLYLLLTFIYRTLCILVCKPLVCKGLERVQSFILLAQLCSHDRFISSFYLFLL